MKGLIDQVFAGSEPDSKFSLSFFSQEVLGNKKKGLDGIHKKLAILEQADRQRHFYIVDPDKTKAITVTKVYSNIKEGELRKTRIQEFSDSHQLQSDFGN
jgi:hypothetical protein